MRICGGASTVLYRYGGGERSGEHGEGVDAARSERTIHFKSDQTDT